MLFKTFLVTVFMLFLTACGTQGPQGAPGPEGPQGAPGAAAPTPAPYTCPGGVIYGGEPVTGLPGQEVCGTTDTMWVCTPSGWQNLNSGC